MGRNGNVVNLGPYDRSIFPAMQMGEDVGQGDLVGIRADTNGIKKWFKAFAGTTGTYTIDSVSVACVQLEALGVAMKDMIAGSWDGIWEDVRIGGKPTTDSAHELYQVGVGVAVWLSATRPGAMVKTAPSGSGKLKQRVGTTYNTRPYPASGDYADGILVRIRDSVTL